MRRDVTFWGGGGANRTASCDSVKGTAHKGHKRGRGNVSAIRRRKSKGRAS